MSTHETYHREEEGRNDPAHASQPFPPSLPPLRHRARYVPNMSVPMATRRKNNQSSINLALPRKTPCFSEIASTRDRRQGGITSEGHKTRLPQQAG